MATTTKALFRGAATTSTGTTLYTVPSATTAVITNIVITNTVSTSATYTLALNGTLIANVTTVPGQDSVVIDLKQVLSAGQTITGGASAVTVNFHICGVEIA